MLIRIQYMIATADSRAVVTLGSPHDQRKQRGGRRREEGASREAGRPDVYWVVLNMNVESQSLGAAEFK